MVGYFIDMPYRNKGYASEALKGLIDWAKQDSSLSNLADTPVDNNSSEKVLEKNGFQQFGEIEEVEHIETILVRHWKLNISR
jgi:RimJ/RimL family protein N-acetyltransferase